jgi:hypothetical protein
MSKTPREKHPAAAILPTVRLVTPASEDTDSVDAFSKELAKLKWVWTGANPNLDFGVCSVKDTNTSLAQQAQKAVNEVQPALQ